MTVREIPFPLDRAVGELFGSRARRVYLESLADTYGITLYPEVRASPRPEADPGDEDFVSACSADLARLREQYDISGLVTR